MSISKNTSVFHFDDDEEEEEEEEVLEEEEEEEEEVEWGFESYPWGFLDCQL